MPFVTVPTPRVVVSRARVAPCAFGTVAASALVVLLRCRSSGARGIGPASARGWGSLWSIRALLRGSLGSTRGA
eukprot:1542387-Alexandrium_andersonii.AAC.1